LCVLFSGGIKRREGCYQNRGGIIQ
jgi:hypothetical protein